MLATKSEKMDKMTFTVPARNEATGGNGTLFDWTDDAVIPGPAVVLSLATLAAAVAWRRRR